MIFLKKDLVQVHYNWNNNDNIFVYDGRPSRRSFDRYNGEQVLFIINSYGATSLNFTIEEGRKIEEVIANNLPLEAKSEISVFNWLQKLFSKAVEK